MQRQRMIDPLEPRRLLSAYWDDAAWSARANSDAAYQFDQIPLGIRSDGSLITFDQMRLNGGVRRYLPDGTPDVDFKARRLEDVWITDAALDVADRAVVAVQLGSPLFETDHDQLRRLTPAGTLDTSFAGDGTFDIVPPSRGSRVEEIATDDYGRILVTVTTEDGPLLGRVHSRGRMDTTFGRRGWARVPVDAGYGDSSESLALLDAPSKLDVRVLPSGQILVVANGGGGFQVLAFDDAGNLDTTWGRDGRFTLPRLFSSYFDTPPRMTIDDAGRMLVGVFQMVPDNPSIPENVPPDGLVVGSIARLLPNGRLDQRFGEGGFVALRTAGAHFEFPRMPVVDDRGRIYVADRFGAVARLLSDGTIDTTFDFDGYFGGAGYEAAMLPAGDDLISFAGGGWAARLTEAPSGPFVSNRTLRVIAQEPGIRVVVGQRGERVSVSINGAAATHFDRSAFDQVEMRLSEGDDTLVYDSTAPLTVNAEAGNDRLDLMRGQHVAHAGAGNDTVTCGDDKDTVYADGGNDVIDLGGGGGKLFAYSRRLEDGDTLDARAAPGEGSVSMDVRNVYNATLRVDGGHAYVFAAARWASISTRSEYDAEVRLGGPRTSFIRVDTGDGNDYVHAGEGRAVIRTGAGDDYVYNLAGDSYIDTGAGDDSVRGGANADTLIGGPGNDTLRGNGGDDLIDGGPGDDRLFGNAGIDHIQGGDGYDRAAVDEEDEVFGIELLLEA